MRLSRFFIDAPLSLGACLERNAVRAPGRAALLYEDRRLSHDELNRAVNRYAHYLAGRGVSKGEVVVLVLDNRHFGETGMQASPTGLGTDLCGLARACGIPQVMEASSMEEVATIRGALHRPDGCLFARIAISAAEHERVMPERDGAKIKDRVRAALGAS